VAAAVTVMIGAILVAVGPVMRMVTKRQPAHLTRLGLDVIAAGIAFGLLVLVVFAVTRIESRKAPAQGKGGPVTGAEPLAGPRGSPRGMARTGPGSAPPRAEVTPHATARRVPSGRPC
jgi:hypothetical protein